MWALGVDMMEVWGEAMDMASPKHNFPFKGTVGQMAQRLGVTRSYLAEVLGGSRGCSGKLAFAIQEATHGRIKAKDLILRKSRQSDPAA